MGNTRLSNPRNVVLVTIDSLRADRTGHLGGSKGLSPTIDSLGSTGIEQQLTYWTRFASWALGDAIPDVVTAVLDWLAAIAPVYAARGNGDNGSGGRPVVPDGPVLNGTILPHLALPLL
jgi:hypothetical protein